MRKGRIQFLFLAFAFVALPAYVHAAVSFTEIMYDYDGADVDWVEVQNTGTDDVDLTSLKLLVSNSTSNHTINNSSGSATLHAGDYGVIVASSVISNYTAVWGSSGNIFTASFTLPNEGGTVEINAGDKTNPMNSVTYASTQGANSDGNSLQKSASGTWTGATPTPGAAMAGQGGDGETNTGGGSAPPSNTQNQDGTKKPAAPPKITAKILTNKTGIAGVAVKFDAQVTGYMGEPLSRGKFFWNLGDGTTLDSFEKEKFEHIYRYPGDYVVVFEYADNPYKHEPDVTSRMLLPVIPSDLSISTVSQDGSVEVSNASKNEIDISGFILRTHEKSFTIPRGTILLPERKLWFDARVTGFAQSPKVELLFPDSLLSFTYEEKPAVSMTPKIAQALSVSAKATSDVLSDSTQVPHATELTASAVSTENSANAKSSSNTLLFILALAGVIGVGGAAFVFSRRKNNEKSGSVIDPDSEANAFTFLDE